MKPQDTSPFAMAISEKLCRPCGEGDARGRCCRPGAQPCALTAHVDLLVEAFTALGRGRTADEYSQALERGLCPHCVRDETGYCSLLELIVDAPDDELLQIVDVILTAQEDLEGRGAATG